MMAPGGDRFVTGVSENSGFAEFEDLPAGDVLLVLDDS